MTTYPTKNLVITYAIVAAYLIAVGAWTIVTCQRFLAGADQPPVWIGVGITLAALPLSKLTDRTLKMK